MNLYQVIVFVHVLGAIGIFVALGIESVSLGRLRSAAALVDARGWSDLHKLPTRLGFLAMMGAIAAGIWLMAKGWGRQPWILSAIVQLVGMMAVGGVISARGTRRLRAALVREDGPGLSDSFRSMQSAKSLRASLRIRGALGIGIVGLMTIKPGAAGAWRMLIAAALSGLIATIPLAASRSSVSSGRNQMGA